MRTVATHEAVEHPKVRQLLGHVAELLHGWRDDAGFDDTEALSAIEDDLLGLAPEFEPPFDDEEHVPEDWQLWRELVAKATGEQP